MSRNVFATSCALLLTILLVVPAALFVAPQRASAQFSSIASAVGCLGGTSALLSGAAGLLESVSPIPIPFLSAVPVNDMIVRAQTTISAGATSQDCINNTILVPLARLLARIVLQQITASTINWINGGNSSGQTLYVQNLPVHLQSVGDSSALAFFTQLERNLHSPFTSAITSSLRTNYLQQTSVAGFFAANQNTLAQSSPNVNAFLAGDWSQGGVAAWFALTTQNQNNPYTLYQASQSQLASLVGGAQAARQQELSWGQGFLSWCDPSEANTTASNDGTEMEGIAPGDFCTKDGVPGKIQTPGSIIHDYTQQAVVNSGISQLVSANDLDSVLGAIISALGKQILGAAGGLFGASQPSGSRPAFVTQLQGYSGSNSTATASSNSIVQTMLARLADYTAAWNTISDAANAASASASALITYCNAQSADPNASQTDIDAQVSAAQTALTTTIVSVLAQAKSALDSVAPTQSFALKVQAESDSTSSVNADTADAAATLSNDIQTLSTMPPSVIDVISAQENAQAFGVAKASPSGSLAVSGGSLVDQMNLISGNAVALQSVCTPEESDNGGDNN